MSSNFRFAWTGEMVDAGAKALRERMQGGKKLVDWERLPNSTKKKWREYSTLVLAAASTSVDPA